MSGSRIVQLGVKSAFSSRATATAARLSPSTTVSRGMGVNH